jgi:hypothetical protein
MTEAQAKFVELEKKKAAVKKYFDELDAALLDVVAEIGIGRYFQDPSDGTVYKTVNPEGIFVPFKKVGYQRTRRLDEKRGDLSMKEAEEAGFVVAK